MPSDLPGFDLGPLRITWFAAIMLAAWSAGGGLAAWRAYRRGENPEIVLQASLWALVLSVLVGRLFFIVSPPPSVAVFYDRAWYFSHFLDMQIGPLALWNGGLGAAGMAVGATLAAGIVVWRNRLDVWWWADIIMPGVLLALVIAPWGNVINGQMFGPPTRLPWGMVTDQRVGVYADLTLWPPETRFHPVPSYLSMWAILTLAGVLVVEQRRVDRLKLGDVGRIGMAGYAQGALIMGVLHVDVSRVVLDLSGSQLLAVLVLVCVGIDMWKKRQVGMAARDINPGG